MIRYWMYSDFLLIRAMLSCNPIRDSMYAQELGPAAYLATIVTQSVARVDSHIYIRFFI